MEQEQFTVAAIATGDIAADPTEPRELAGASLPTPPALHWALVLLFSIASLGVFGLAWSFVQARWVRRIDPDSHALKLLGIGTGCLVVGTAMAVAAVMVAAGNDSSDAFVLLVWGALLLPGKLLTLAWLVLYVVAHFSMASSTRRHAASQGIALEYGGGTLFFFTVFYLQALLSWLAHCETTGATSPAAPRGIFWLLTLLMLFVLGVVAAIALPNYADQVIRTQVAEGEMLAAPAKAAMVTYYQRHHVLPADNVAAGLAQSASISGSYVSAVNVAGGAVTVSFDTPAARRDIRHQALVYFPVIDGDHLRWDCNAYSTVPARDLPRSCRK